MKRTLLGALVLGMGAVSAPGALAAEIIGGCGYNAVTVPDRQGGGTRVGVMYLQYVVYSSMPGEPVSVTVRCYLKVNGEVRATLNDGALVNYKPVTYKTYPGDFEQLCQDVSYSNGVSTSECFWTGFPSYDDEPSR